jgi:hypothetical protein
MRKEAQINGRVYHLLDREALVWIEFLAGTVSITRRIEKFDNLSIAHKGELSTMRRKQAGKLLRERFVVPSDFGTFVFDLVRHWYATPRAT